MGHRVAGVEREVQHHALESTGVEVNGTRRAPEVHADVHVAAKRAPEQPQNALEDAGEVEILRMGGALAREVE
jgi:hypothetical protein